MKSYLYHILSRIFEEDDGWRKYLAF